MSVHYRATVETNDGVYRAIFINSRLIEITEDGEEGLTDFVDLDEDIEETSDNLIHILLVWVYEMRRGLDITKATVRLVSQR